MSKKTTKAATKLKTVEDYANHFGVKMRLGVEAVKEAAETYVEAVWKFPKVAQETFARQFPGVGPHTWDLLQRIGNGDLHPKAMLLPYEVARRMSAMPMENQDAIFAEGVDGFQVVSRFNLEPRLIPLTSLSQRAAEIVIDDEHGRVRTIEEQKRLIIRNRKGSLAVDPATHNKINYTIIGSSVRIGNVEIGLKMLKRLVSEIEAKLERDRR